MPNNQALLSGQESGHDRRMADHSQDGVRRSAGIGGAGLGLFMFVLDKITGGAIPRPFLYILLLVSIFMIAWSLPPIMRGIADHARQRKRMFPFVGMIVCGIGCIGFAGWYFWRAPAPTKVVSVAPQAPSPAPAASAARTQSTPSPAQAGPVVRPITPETAKPRLQERPATDDAPLSVPVPTRAELVVQVDALSGNLLRLEQSIDLQSRSISARQPTVELTPEQQIFWRTGQTNQIVALYSEQARIFSRDYREKANTLFKALRDRTGLSDTDLPDMCGNHTQYMLASGELSGPYALSKIAQCLQTLSAKMMEQTGSARKAQLNAPQSPLGSPPKDPSG